MVAQYAAPYEGNFLLSLKNLEKELKHKFNASVVYVFPKSVANRNWFESFSKEHVTFLTVDEVACSVEQLVEIISIFIPDIIHTHFDGYDMPVAKALKKCGKNNIKVVWHLHDALGFVPNVFKKMYQCLYYIRHYSYYAKNVSAIAVSDEVRRFTNRFHRVLRFSDFHNSKVILNGIDLARIENNTRKSNKEKGGIYKLLVLSGRNVQKRADLLMKAGLVLESRGISNFEILVVHGTDTNEVVADVFGDKTPHWLKLLPQNHNIAELFALADCFVSTSVAETFSYAICEATIYGLPVIQSDIEATVWNKDNPSTFLFPNGDVNALADTIVKVMGIPKDEMEKACEVTKQNNRSKYSINAWCDDIIEYYLNL